MENDEESRTNGEYQRFLGEVSIKSYILVYILSVFFKTLRIGLKLILHKFVNNFLCRWRQRFRDKTVERF